MASDACTNFSQHAWKRDYCANCLKAKARHAGPIPAQRTYAAGGRPLTSTGLATEVRATGNGKELNGNESTPTRGRPRPAEKPSMARHDSKERSGVSNRINNSPRHVNPKSTVGTGVLTEPAPSAAAEDGEEEHYKAPNANAAANQESDLLSEIEDMLGSHYYHKYDFGQSGQSGKPRPLKSAETRDAEAKHRVKAIEEFRKQRESKGLSCEVVDIPTEHIAMPYTFVDVSTIPLSSKHLDKPPQLPEVAAPKEVDSPAAIRRLSGLSTFQRQGSPAPVGPAPPSPKLVMEDVRVSPSTKRAIIDPAKKLKEEVVVKPKPPDFSARPHIEHAYEPMECDFDGEEEGRVLQSVGSHGDEDEGTTFTRLNPIRASAMTAEFEAKMTAAANANVQKSKNSTKTLDALNVDTSLAQKKEDAKVDKSKKQGKSFFRKLFSFGGKDSQDDEVEDSEPMGSSVDAREPVVCASQEDESKRTSSLPSTTTRGESMMEHSMGTIELLEALSRSHSLNEQNKAKMLISEPIITGGSNVPLACVDDISPDSTMQTDRKHDSSAKNVKMIDVKKPPSEEYARGKPASREHSMRRIKRPPSVPPPVPGTKHELMDEGGHRPPLSPKPDIMSRSVVKTSSNDSVHSGGRLSDSLERNITRSPGSPRVPSPAGNVHLDGTDTSPATPDSLGSVSINSTSSPPDVAEEVRGAGRLDGVEGAVGGLDSGYSGDGTSTGGSSSGSSIGPRSKSSSDMPTKQGTGRVTRRMMSAPPPPPADSRRFSVADSTNASSTCQTLPRKPTFQKAVSIQDRDPNEVILPTKGKSGSFVRKPARRKTLSEGMKFDVEVVDISLKNKKTAKGGTLDKSVKFVQRALPSPPVVPPVAEVNGAEEEADIDNLYETVSLEDVNTEPVHTRKDKYKAKPTKPIVTQLGAPEVPPPIMTNSAEYLTPLSNPGSDLQAKSPSTSALVQSGLVAAVEARVHQKDWRPKTAGQSRSAGAMSNSESYVMLYENKEIIEERDRPALTIHEGYQKMTALHQETLHEFMNNIYSEFVPNNGRVREDLQWVDFCVSPARRPTHSYSGVAFFQTKCTKVCTKDKCLVMLSSRTPFQSCVEYSHANVLSPSAVFQDSIPADFFPDPRDLDEPAKFRKLRRMTTNVLVFKYTSITSLHHYMNSVVPLQTTEPEEFECLVCYIMDQVINGLLYLRGKECNQYSVDTKDILLVTTGSYQEKYIVINPHCIEKQSRSQKTMGENLKQLLVELLQSTVSAADSDQGVLPLNSSYSRALCKLAQLFTEEGPEMLERARNLLELALWGPSQDALHCLALAEDRPQAFEVWLSLERCRMVTRYALQVLQPRLEEAHHIRFLCSLSGEQLFHITKLLHK